MGKPRNIIKISKFTDLKTWKEAHVLTLATYRLTKLFPKEELYSLTNQMRRCAISITSNIAEGFSRSSFKEKTQFYYVSKGSLTELQNQLLLAKDLDYISQDELRKIGAQTVVVGKLLTGLIKSAKNNKITST